MNERKWLTCQQPSVMLDYVHIRISRRKLGLIAAAWWRSVSLHDEIDEEIATHCESGLEESLIKVVLDTYLSSRWFESENNKLVHHGTHLRGCDIIREVVGNPFYPVLQCKNCLGRGLIGAIMKRGPEPGPEIRYIIEPPMGYPCPRCAGSGSNKSSGLDSWLSWHDGAVRKMASTIYDERRFEDCPILADALEEAGCQEESILRHLRAKEGDHIGCPRCDWTGKLEIPALPRGWQYCPHCKDRVAIPHVRGCWVLDILTNKV